jgi:hypothetical protein
MKIIFTLAIGLILSSQAMAWGGGRVTGADCKSKCDCSASNIQAKCMLCCSNEQGYSEEKEELDKTASGPEMDMDEAASYGDNPSA